MAALAPPPTGPRRRVQPLLWRLQSFLASYVPLLLTAALAGLTWPAFLLRNLLPVTLGNLLGGGVLVGAVYWFIYLRAPVAAAPR